MLFLLLLLLLWLCAPLGTLCQILLFPPADDNETLVVAVLNQDVDKEDIIR